MSMMPQAAPKLNGSAGGLVGPTQAGMNSLMGGNSIPRGYRLGKIQQFSPEQVELFSQLFSHVGPQSYLSRLSRGEEGLPDEEQAWRDYQGSIGGLASRFSGMGTGLQKSSGFQNTMSQSAQDFALGLKSQRQQLQREALQELFGLSEALLGQRPSEQFLVQKSPKTPSFLKQLGLGAASGLSHAAGGIFGSFL